MRRLTAAPRPLGGPVRVIDVGTGSGAIAIAVAVALRKRRVPTDEVDAPRRRHRRRTRWTSPARTRSGTASATGCRSPRATCCRRPTAAAMGRRLANLPYVRAERWSMRSPAASPAFEPRLALDGGPDGLTSIGRLVDLLPKALARRRGGLPRDRRRPGRGDRELPWPPARLVVRGHPGPCRAAADRPSRARARASR